MEARSAERSSWTKGGSAVDLADAVDDRAHEGDADALLGGNVHCAEVEDVEDINESSDGQPVLVGEVSVCLASSHQHDPDVEPLSSEALDHEEQTVPARLHIQNQSAHLNASLALIICESDGE